MPPPTLNYEEPVISTHDEWLITRWWGRLHRLDERR